jgi:hypothetical protein
VREPELGVHSILQSYSLRDYMSQGLRRRLQHDKTFNDRQGVGFLNNWNGRTVQISHYGVNLVLYYSAQKTSPNVEEGLY